MAFFILWIWTWDDKIDDANGSLHKDIVGTHQYREDTIKFTRYTLGVSCKEGETDTSLPVTPVSNVVQSFDVVGEGIRAVYTQSRYSDVEGRSNKMNSKGLKMLTLCRTIRDFCERT